MSLIGTQIPSDVYQYISKNAGIIANAFDTSTGTIKRADIKGATTGGITFTDKPTYTDNGDDVDNMPTGTMEMKELDSREINVSGTFVSVTPHALKDLDGAADLTTITAGSASGTAASGETVAGGATSKITPRDELKVADFQDHLWFITDYGKGGYIAIRLDNVLNEDGLSIKSTNKGKGQYAFNYKAHYSIDDPDTVPFEIFIKPGDASESTDTPHSDATT